MSFEGGVRDAQMVDRGTCNLDASLMKVDRILTGRMRCNRFAYNAVVLLLITQDLLLPAYDPNPPNKHEHD